MDLPQLELLLNRLSDFVQEHWWKTLGAFAITVTSGWWGIFWAWRRWRTRHDMDVIHYSQNTIESRPTGPEGKTQQWLILDVYAENPLDGEITHPIPRRLIRKAAKKTTAKQPFLVFHKEDRWYILNLFRLAIAEQFKQGTAAKLSKLAKVDVIECVFAPTYERYPNMRQGKIRVMIVQKSLMDDPHAFDGELQFESASHSDRVETLRRMQHDYLRGEENWEYCLTVRLNIQL